MTGMNGKLTKSHAFGSPTKLIKVRQGSFKKTKKKYLKQSNIKLIAWKIKTAKKKLDRAGPNQILTKEITAPATESESEAKALAKPKLHSTFSKALYALTTQAPAVLEEMLVLQSATNRGN